MEIGLCPSFGSYQIIQMDGKVVAVCVKHHDLDFTIISGFQEPTGVGRRQNENNARFYPVCFIVDFQDTGTMSGIADGKCVNGKKTTDFIIVRQCDSCYCNMVFVIDRILMMS